MVGSSGLLQRGRVQECGGLRGCRAEAGCSRSQEGTAWGRGGKVPSGTESHTVCHPHTHGFTPNAYQ